MKRNDNADDDARRKSRKKKRRKRFRLHNLGDEVVPLRLPNTSGDYECIPRQTTSIAIGQA